MNIKGIKKGDIVKIKTANGETKIMRVEKASKKEIKGDTYEFEKDYSKGNFSSYKVKEKDTSFSNAVIEKVEGQLLNNNLRIKVDKDLMNEKTEHDKEETINRKSSAKKKKVSSPRSSEGSSPKRKNVKNKKSSIKKTQVPNEMSTLKVTKKRTKSAASQNNPELTQQQQMKLERDKIKEEKKKARERKQKLKKIIPNDDIDKIEINSFLEQAKSKKEQEFPLEGCSKFSDNRKFLFLYFQNNKKAREELERLITKDSSLSNPFQNYSTNVDRNIMDFAIIKNDIEMIKMLIKESNRIQKGESKRPNLPTSSLTSVGTGTFNIYQFGFATKKVSLARGGKEGNNAFTYDNNLFHSGYYPELNHLIELDASYEVIQCFIMNKYFNENDMFEVIWNMVRRGNIELLKSKLKKDGPTLLQRLVENMGYGFNRYHYAALENDVEGRINRFSMIKKPHTNKGISPLHIACINPDITVLRKFYTANPEISVADMDQRKMIHYAAANKTDVALNFLSSKGANLNDRDLRGTTPLMIACELGRTDNVLFLLNEQKKVIESLDKDDEDYLLMKRTSNMAITFGPNHQSPLHFAILSGNVECVKALVDNSDNEIDLNATTTDGKSPISMACSLGYYDIAKYLLSKDVSVHETKKQKKNPLIWAAQNGHIHIVSLLLRHGIHPDLTDSSGNTAVHYAAGYGWLHVLKFLIENGAHPDLKNEWNSTPAMVAMLKIHFGCLDYLMGLEEVNKSMVDNEGRSVISQLCMNFTKDTLLQIKYMDKFDSIDYNLKDATGFTCMHFLAASKIQYHHITNEIHKILAEKKTKLERKLGRNLSTERSAPFKSKRMERTKKKVRSRPFIQESEKMEAPSFNLNKSMEVEEDEENEDDENLQTFAIYYDQGNVKHRKLFREISEEFQDRLIECAEYLYSKGLTKDSFNNDGYSALRIAVENSNIKLAMWMIDTISDLKEDHFKIDENVPSHKSFLTNLSNFQDEIDWEPLIKTLIKTLDIKTLHSLISYKQNGNSILINYVQCRPNSQYRANDKMYKYQTERFQLNLGLLLEIAQTCDYDISDQISFNKNYAYGYQGVTQEKIDSYFDSPNKTILQKRVNSFGIYDNSLNESDLLYFEPGCPFGNWGVNNVRSNLLHTLIRGTMNEEDMFY